MAWLLFPPGLPASPPTGSVEMDEPAIRFPEDFNRKDLESLLHAGHPRLIATKERWSEIREAARHDPHLAATIAVLTEVAATIEKTPPKDRVMTGLRLLSVSREVLRRTLVLGVMHRITGEDRYFERARAELLAAADFEDWNPSHFLDTAEMTLAVAVGYDWFYDELSGEERAKLRRAILKKGLEPGTGDHRWKRGDNNWNQVCFAGMVAGALAIADHQPDIAVRFLREMFENIHRPLEVYRPHGAYPEGPIYWTYGTSFQVILISVLESALGQTWGIEDYPGFQESAVYINQMIGPSGDFYNYADCAPRVPAMPALHWFAREAGNPALNARERERLSGDPKDLASHAHANRLFSLSVVWLRPGVDRAQPEPLPLHWRADGPNPVAVHRRSWENDALFVGIKGGSPGGNHGHMDIGSFVLDWRGVRWAVDLGMQGYHSLESRGLGIWNRSQDGDRWRVFRMNTLSHNTLVVDRRQQRVEGFAPISAFSNDPKSPFTVVDMSEVYADSLERSHRGMRLLDDGETVILDDEISGLAADREVRWGMVTRAELDLSANRAVLRQDGEELHVHILSPAGARFETVPTDPPPNDFDASNPGTRMLAFHVKGKGESQKLRVAFALESLSPEDLDRIRSLPPCSEWRSERAPTH